MQDLKDLDLSCLHSAVDLNLNLGCCHIRQKRASIVSMTRVIIHKKAVSQGFYRGEFTGSNEAWFSRDVYNLQSSIFLLLSLPAELIKIETFQLTTWNVVAVLGNIRLQHSWAAMVHELIGRLVWQFLIDAYSFFLWSIKYKGIKRIYRREGIRWIILSWSKIILLLCCQKS